MSTNTEHPMFVATWSSAHSPDVTHSVTCDTAEEAVKTLPAWGRIGSEWSKGNAWGFQGIQAKDGDTLIASWGSYSGFTLHATRGSAALAAIKASFGYK